MLSAAHCARTFKCAYSQIQFRRCEPQRARCKHTAHAAEVCFYILPAILRCESLPVRFLRCSVTCWPTRGAVANQAWAPCPPHMEPRKDADSRRMQISRGFRTHERPTCRWQRNQLPSQPPGTRLWPSTTGTPEMCCMSFPVRYRRSKTIKCLSS